MKTTNKRSIYALTVIAMLIMATISCDNEDEEPQIEEPENVVPVLTTSVVTDITQIAAISGGNISSDYGDSPTERGVCWSTDTLPTTASSHTSDGTGFGQFFSTMELLTDGTIYHVRAYAINSAGTGYGNDVIFSTQEASPVTTTDIDGNIYHVVTIGTQDWMVENLEVIHYRNGDPITNITDKNTWATTSDGAYCFFDNDTLLGQIYGNYYNWAAVNDPRNIAPEGFHVPTFDEWMILVNYLGGQMDAGGKLKETGITHWSNTNVGATNETGFSALPAGRRDGNGDFDNISGYCYFWTITEDNPYAFFFGLNSASTIVLYAPINKENGYSVRCVRD
jgi:uncharacterized protein (TIGR02145 family)